MNILSNYYYYVRGTGTGYHTITDTSTGYLTQVNGEREKKKVETLQT